MIGQFFVKLVLYFRLKSKFLPFTISLEALMCSNVKLSNFCYLASLAQIYSAKIIQTEREQQQCQMGTG